MGCKQVHLLLCVVYCFSTSMSMESSFQFINVDFIEGAIMRKTKMEYVEGCLAVCAQHTPPCGGTAYSVVNKTCVLLDKWAMDKTVYILRAIPSWTYFKTVGHK